MEITLDGDRARTIGRGRCAAARGPSTNHREHRRGRGPDRLAVGGNSTWTRRTRYPALLDFLAAQDFAPQLAKVTFKPVIREKTAAASKGMIPLTSSARRASRSTAPA